MCVCMHVHLLITGKLRHYIKMTHRAIEIVVEPALNLVLTHVEDGSRSGRMVAL